MAYLGKWNNLVGRLELLEKGNAGVQKKVAMIIDENLNSLGVSDLDTLIIDSTLDRSFGGGKASGAKSFAPRKSGIKITLLVDANGVHLVKKALMRKK